MEHTSVFVSVSQDGKELKPGKNCRIYSTGRKRFCQIMQCSRANSGTYTCDTGEINTSCSLEVYGKCLKSSAVTHITLNIENKIKYTNKNFTASHYTETV